MLQIVLSFHRLINFLFSLILLCLRHRQKWKLLCRFQKCYHFLTSYSITLLTHCTRFTFGSTRYIRSLRSLRTRSKMLTHFLPIIIYWTNKFKSFLINFFTVSPQFTILFFMFITFLKLCYNPLQNVLYLLTKTITFKVTIPSPSIIFY